MRSLIPRLLVAATILPLIGAIARCEQCNELKLGISGASTLIPCVAQEAKDILELKAKLDAQERELAKLRSDSTELKAILLRGDIRKKLDEVTERLIGEVNSVYTISAEYRLDARQITPTSYYIYADPRRHDISVVVYSRGLVPVGNEFLTFSFDFSVNKRIVYSNASRIEKDDPLVAEYFRHPLQGSGGAGRDEGETQGTDLSMAYPVFIHLVEINPHIPTDPSKIPDVRRKDQTVSIQGYILVKRKKVVEREDEIK
jgi:hypothetical protein